MGAPTIDNWLLATVNMWVCDLSCREARRLIEENFEFEQVFEAYVRLAEILKKKKPTKHRNQGEKKNALDSFALNENINIWMFCFTFILYKGLK